MIRNSKRSHGGILLAAWLVGVFFLLGGLTSEAIAQSCDEGGCLAGCDGGGDCLCGSCCCSCCPWEHCTGVWGEFLYFQATGADMAHAQQQNGVGGAGTTPFGRIGVADPDYQPGFALGLNWAMTNCSSLVFAYEHYGSNTNDTLALGPGVAIGSLVQHPGAGVISSAGPVTAAYGIDYDLFDVECRHLLMGDDRSWMNYTLGVRYGHLDQDFLQAGAFAGSQNGVINVLTDIEFDGGGFSFGLDGERRLGCRGFSCYGNIGVSPLVGQFNTSYTMVNTTGNVLLANALWKDDRFVTILDYEIGIAWTSCNRCWKISSGYNAAFWYNTVTTPVFISAVQGNNYVDVGDTLSFDGFSARIERRF